MEKWFIKNKSGDFRRMAKEFDIPEITAKILINRNINTKRAVDSYINSSLDRLYDPKLMKDLVRAVDILENKIKEKKPIRIIGDYDVDGVMSTYILYTSITNLGGIVDYDIPDRVSDGYGINKKMIDKANKDDIDTIITCDNGIAAIEEVRYAKELGITIIVTDHHDLPFIEDGGEREIIYVEADAIINPKREDCDYPFNKLCGAGVAYKLIDEINKRFNRWMETYKYLEYVAIATICDVVDLVDENRILVKLGLKDLNKTKNIGLQALIEEAELNEAKIGVYHVGFIIGPCINASGRLDTAIKALDLLLTDNPLKAKEIAKELRSLNEERKEITEKGTEKIIKRIDEETGYKNDSVLVIYEPSIHESVAGIIAGRIKDMYYKPTIVLTNSSDVIKGSGRSIDEYNIFEGLTREKELLDRFGGHPMAAGLSLREENIKLLRQRLNDNELTQDDLKRKLYIDLPLSLDDINYKLINELDRLEPFGKGNSRPLFGAKNIRLAGGKVLGKNNNVLKLNLLNSSGNIIEGMLFNNIDDFEKMIVNNYGEETLDRLYNGDNNDILLDIIYYPDINEFRGKITLQSIIQSYRISE